MKNASLVLGLSVLFTVYSSYATENIVVSAKQIQSLGITTIDLPDKHSGDVSGLPAQVVIPGNQLFAISSPLMALVEQTLVGVGDSVKKGQTIARLQSPLLAEAQRSLLQAHTQYQIAKENLARDESLNKDGIISESRYRATRALALEAKAALSERKQMLRISGMSDGAITQLLSTSNLSSQLTLTSPIDGVVLEKSVSTGQHLDASVLMFKIAKLSPLALEIQAPLSQTHYLKLGSTISIPEFSASGKITAIGRSLTGTNQTVLLRGTIFSGAENLRPGQFLEVSISTGTNNDAQWEIPNSAISRIDGHTVLFVQTPQGFRSQVISILNEGTQNSVISGNLKGNEKIAVKGVSTLKSSFIGIGGTE